MKRLTTDAELIDCFWSLVDKNGPLPEKSTGEIRDHPCSVGSECSQKMANLFCNVWSVAVTICISHEGVELKRTRERAEPLLGFIPSP